MMPRFRDLFTLASGRRLGLLALVRWSEFVPVRRDLLHVLAAESTPEITVRERWDCVAVAGLGANRRGQSRHPRNAWRVGCRRFRTSWLSRRSRGSRFAFVGR